MAAPTIDGSAQGQNGSGGSSQTVVTCVLTTTSAADLIVVVAGCEVNAASPGPAISTIVAAGLTFTKRGSASEPPGGGEPPTTIEMWVAQASVVLTTTTITVTFASSFDNAGVVAFGVTGAVGPFDPHSGLPVAVANTTQPPVVTGVSTSNANDLLLMMYAAGSTANVTIIPTMPTGFTELAYCVVNATGRNYYRIAVIYQELSATITNQTITWGSSAGSTTGNAILVDAITAGGAVAPKQRFLACGMI